MKPKQEKFLMTIGAGVLEPGDDYTRSRLRAKGYKRGDQVMITISKCRQPKFHRFVHQFAVLMSENIEEFSGMDAHRILKRLQFEANIYCEEMGVKIPGYGFGTARIPQSIAFDSMDEGQFEEFYKTLCRYVSKNYWPELSDEQIEQMIQFMPGDVA